MACAVRTIFALLAAGCWLLAPLTAQAQEARISLRVLATTDIHTAMLGYDYYQAEETVEYGLARVATLVRQARAEHPNTLLFDNGDLLQGNPFGDYVARRRGVGPDKIHPIYAAMNTMGYDAAVVGNHEFNFGLPFLEDALKGAAFPYTVANVWRVDANGKRTVPFLPRSLILERDLIDSEGQRHRVKIGVIGLVTPQIMVWDRDKLQGRLATNSIVTTAREMVPKLRAEGADIVIVLAHTGIGSPDAGIDEENVGWLVSQVPGIDAIITGHSHAQFPGEFYRTLKNTDIDRGTINGVAVVMANAWGSHLGIIELNLRKDAAGVSVVDRRAFLRPVHERRDGKSVALVEPDPAVDAAVREVHEATTAYMATPVAESRQRLSTYLAPLGDIRAISLIHDAQRRYAEKALKNTPYEKLPLLSAAAPFKMGGRMGANYYTDIAAGPIALRDVGDLYIYPNAAVIVKVTGAELREWLERTAIVFNRIDPASAEPQPLMSGSPSYDFDVIDGLTYAIDVTQPPRYERDSPAIANPQARRIVDLKYQGRAVADDDVFAVATNTYRANGGGRFPILDGSQVIFGPIDLVLTILTDDLRAQGMLDPKPQPIWRFAPIAGEPIVTIDIGADGAEVAAADARLRKIEALATGYVRYAVDLP